MGIVPVAVAVPLAPVLAVIMIIRTPYNYCTHPRTFLSLVMDYVTCTYFVPDATERLSQQKFVLLEDPLPLGNRRGNSKLFASYFIGFLLV